jgi:dienelactone hydrolase
MRTVFSLLLLLLAACTNDKPASEVDPLRAALQVPYFRNPLDSRLVKSWRHLDLVFEQVDFQGRYKQRIPALICYSEIARTHPLPVIVCMPGSSNRKEDLLQPLDLIPRWAEKGFFVISIDRPYGGDRSGDLGEAVRQKGLLKVWGEYVYDLMCALDYLQTRRETDGQYIGMLGLSMGGWEALLLAALDQRVDVVVSVAGQLHWKEVFRERAWQAIFQGLDLRQELVERQATSQEAWQAFRRTYPDIDQVDAALLVKRIAPRPILLMTGSEDTFITPATTQKTHEAATAVYRKMGMGERLDIWIAPDTGHSFPTSMQERALAWFERWLRDV